MVLVTVSHGFFSLLLRWPVRPEIENSALVSQHQHLGCFIGSANTTVHSIVIVLRTYLQSPRRNMATFYSPIKLIFRLYFQRGKRELSKTTYEKKKKKNQILFGGYSSNDRKLNFS